MADAREVNNGMLRTADGGGNGEPPTMRFQKSQILDTAIKVLRQSRCCVIEKMIVNDIAKLNKILSKYFFFCIKCD